MQQNSFLIRFFFLWLSFIPLLSLSQSQPLVFTGATVIDMTGAKPKPDMTVIVSPHWRRYAAKVKKRWRICANYIMISIYKSIS